jgi:hypothetical protein
MSRSATRCHQLVDSDLEEELTAEIQRLIQEVLLPMASTIGCSLGTIMIKPGNPDHVFTHANDCSSRSLMEHAKQQWLNLKELFISQDNEMSDSNSTHVLNPLLLTKLEENENHMLRMVVKDYIFMHGCFSEDYLPEELKVPLPIEQNELRATMEKAKLKGTLRWFYFNGFRFTPALLAYISQDGERLPEIDPFQKHLSIQLPICWNPTKELDRTKTWKATLISKRLREIFYFEKDNRKSIAPTKTAVKKARGPYKRKVVVGVENLLNVK